MASEKKKQIGLPTAVLIVGILITLVLILTIRKKTSTSYEQSQSRNYTPQPQVPQNRPTVDIELQTPLAKLDSPGTAGLQDIIRSRTTWDPVFTSWYGRTAPDFTFTDINGKTHKLSDYHGRDVMLIFWATWCLPCREEIPDLIKLRKQISTDSLAMLAISYEDLDTVKKFVAQAPINYTVISASAAPPPLPFSKVFSIPCAFFIDPKGRIKLATIGILPLDQTKAILRAKPRTP